MHGFSLSVMCIKLMLKPNNDVLICLVNLKSCQIFFEAKKNHRVKRPHFTLTQIMHGEHGCVWGTGAISRHCLTIR